MTPSFVGSFLSRDRAAPTSFKMLACKNSMIDATCRNAQPIMSIRHLAIFWSLPCLLYRFPQWKVPQYQGMHLPANSAATQYLPQQLRGQLACGSRRLAHSARQATTLLLKPVFFHRGRGLVADNSSNGLLNAIITFKSRTEICMYMLAFHRYSRSHCAPVPGQQDYRFSLDGAPDVEVACIWEAGNVTRRSRTNAMASIKGCLGNLPGM